MSVHKTSNTSSSSEHKADLTKVLKPWANERAGLLYVAFNAIKQHAEYGSDNTVSDSDRYIALRNGVLLISYISAAKNCLTQQVKDMIVEGYLGWSGGILSKDDLYKFVEDGANMNESAFDFYLKQEQNLVSKTVGKEVLYLSLVFSGVDGLNTEEIIRFLRVGRHMGVSEKDLNDLLVTYFHEISLIESFNSHSKL